MIEKKTVAQGTFYLAISSIFFVLCSYLMHSALGRLLNPDNYGIFGLVLSILVWLEILFGGITGSTVKIVAEHPKSVAKIEKDSTKLLLITAASVFTVAFLLSPLLARLFDEPSINTYLRIALADIPFLAIYRVYISLLNGLRLYERQAIASMAYIFAKVVFIVGFVLLDLSITGALIGNVIASVCGLTVAILFTRVYERRMSDGEAAPAEEVPSMSALARVAVPFTIFALLYNSIMNIDLWFVQGLLSNTSETGYYVAALNLSRALFYTFSALSFALFPAITGSISRGDTARTKDYIEKAFRSLLVFLVPLSIFMATTSSRLVTLIYSSKYLSASGPLIILAFAYALFSFVIACLYILMANNKFKEVLFISVCMVMIDMLFCIFLIPSNGLNGAAMSTMFTCLFGLLISTGFIWRHFRILVDIYSFLRILASSILASTLLLLPAKGILLLVAYAAAAIVYAFLLWLVKELGSEDVATLRNMLKRDQGSR